MEDYNGMIEAKAKTIKLIMLSAAEAEYVTVFYTAEGAVALAQAAEAMGHKQGTIRICTDNRVAVGLANSTMNIKRTRTINTKSTGSEKEFRQANSKFVGYRAITTLLMLSQNRYRGRDTKFF